MRALTLPSLAPRFDLDLPLWPLQRAALMAPAQEILFGGAAAGGKSYLLRVATILWCLWVPGFQAYLFRRHYPDLKKNHLQGSGNYHELLAPLVSAGHCEIVERQIRFWNGSSINLSALQYHKDLAKYHGAEIHGLAMDESTHFTGDEYTYLRGRVRLGGLSIPPGLEMKFPRILCGTNPGGRGHHYFKLGFVDLGAFTVTKMPKKEGGMTRTFIPARLEDNPTTLINDPDYADRLEGLGDPLLVKALREGDWEIIAGSMFAERWRARLHVIDPFPIPVNWKIWRGGDDGFAAPASVSWMTRDPLGHSYFVIAELYRKAMDAPEWARRTIEIDHAIPRIDASGEWFPNPEAISGGIDTSAFAKHGEARLSRGAQMNKLGAKWRRIEKGPGSRVRDVQNFQRLLATNAGDPGKRPGIMFFRSCRNHIRTIPALLRDERKPEDVDTDMEDHAWDSCRYAITSRHSGGSTTRVAGI